jgi:hypothetical protein
MVEKIKRMQFVNISGTRDDRAGDVLPVNSSRKKYWCAPTMLFYSYIARELLKSPFS